VGHSIGLFAITDDGIFWKSGESVESMTKAVIEVRIHDEGGYSSGDVVGLLLMPAQRRLILTKNGEIWGEHEHEYSFIFHM
jgi:hypothetical protein